MISGLFYSITNLIMQLVIWIIIFAVIAALFILIYAAGTDVIYALAFGLVMSFLL